VRVLLVVGSAPCLYEDYDTARELFPESEVMTINEASGALEDVDHVLAGHTAKAEQFVKYRREKFPDCKAFKVHASWARINEAPRDEQPSVTDWWGGEVSSGATSAGKAIRIAKKMGFDKVVLCGCPLDSSGYFNPNETEAMQREYQHLGKCARVGYVRDKENRSVVRYRETFRKLAETEWAGWVFSMSGLSRELLGAPDASN
jgi:hypothetical protein